MTITQAYRIFYNHRIRHLVVLDERLAMVGILTQTDLVRSLREKAFSGIHDVSRLNIIVGSKMLLIKARRVMHFDMARRAVSCIVVVENDRPVGIFTERESRFVILPRASILTPSPWARS